MEPESRLANQKSIHKKKEKRLPRPFLAFTAVTLIMCCAAGISFAADIAVKPGLWEVSASSRLLAMVPTLPPERMEQLRSLAKEHGFNMPKIDNGAAVTRVCITPDMAKRDSIPNLYQAQSGCSSRNARRDGNRFSMDVSCSGGRFHGAGHSEAVLQNPERFTGESSFTGTIDGQPVNERAHTNGRWISANCESLPP
jgi:hypothetical protein